MKIPGKSLILVSLLGQPTDTVRGTCRKKDKIKHQWVVVIMPMNDIESRKNWKDYPNGVSQQTETSASRESFWVFGDPQGEPRSAVGSPWAKVCGGVQPSTSAPRYLRRTCLSERRQVHPRAGAASIREEGLGKM